MQGAGGGPFGGGMGQQGTSQQTTLIPYGNQPGQTLIGSSYILGRLVES